MVKRLAGVALLLSFVAGTAHAEVERIARPPLLSPWESQVARARGLKLAGIGLVGAFAAFQLSGALLTVFSVRDDHSNTRAEDMQLGVGITLVTLSYSMLFAGIPMAAVGSARERRLRRGTTASVLPTATGLVATF